MSKTIRTLIISAFALTVLLALAAFTGVSTALAHGGGGRGAGIGVPGGPRGLVDRDAMEAVIADALGISVEELQAARDAGTRLEDLADAQGVEMATIEAAVYDAHVAAVNDAVAAGDLTQAEADVLLERLALQQLARQVIDKDAIDAAVAELLGVTVEELQAAHGDRAAMTALLDAAGVTRADVQATVEATRQALVDAAVADGTLTAEQAEQILAGGPRGGHGGPGGRGGRRGSGGLNGQATPSSTTASGIDA